MMNLYNLIFKKTLLIFLFVFSIIVFSACESDKVKEDRYNSVLNLAIENFKQGNFKECIKYCDEATAIIKKKEDPFIMKSFSFYFLKDYKQGVTQADKAIDLGDLKTYAFKAKSLNLKGLGKLEDALEIAMKHYNNYNDDLEIVFLIGDLYSSLENHRESIGFYSKCIDNDYKYVDAKIKRGLAYKSLGEDLLSIQDFESLQGIEVYQNKINLLIGELKLKQKHFDDALNRFRNTDTVYTSKYIGLTFEAMNQKDSALFYYNKYLKINGVNDKEIELKKLELESDKLSFFEKSKEKHSIIYKEKKDSIYMVLILGSVFLLILYFFILPKLIKRKISKEDYFDTYSEETALDFAKYRFVTGGSWIYTYNTLFQNEGNLIKAQNQSIAFFSVVLLMLRNFYFYGLSIGVYFYDYLHFTLLIISLFVFIRLYLLDVNTCRQRVNDLNIFYRKSISNENCINRDIKIKDLIDETDSCVKRLRNNIQSLKHI